MKKWISCLLAVVMLLAALPGCAADRKTNAETASAGSGIFSQLTGIADDQNVMTINDTNITAQEYLYWLTYRCASMEYNILNYNAYYGAYEDLVNQEDSNVRWNNAFQDGQTLAQYVRQETESTLRFYAAIAQMAEKYHVRLDKEDQAAITESLNNTIQEQGGQEGFHRYLQKLGISQETFRELSESGYLFDDLLELVLQEGSELYLPLERYDSYATYADHILLTTIDTTTGQPLSDEMIQTKKALAEDLLAQLKAAKPEEVPALFAQLADKYSEDPGRAENPEGYIFTPNTMLLSFEEAANSLAVGQISDIVDSDYGYHIILRKDLAQALEKNPQQRASLAQKHLTALLTSLGNEAAVTVAPEIEKLDISVFYPAYAAKIKALSTTAETAETAATGESK